MGEVAAQIAERLVGRSRAVRSLRRRIEGLAPLAVPVLLCGGPGSGRSTVARLLHALGPMAGGPFVPIESGEFAPERGVPFGSSVYLRDVERLSRRAQAWCLERIRAASAREADRRVRWLAATGDWPSLREQAPEFDPELERLLLRFAIRVPPLRERRVDIPTLVADLCRRIGRAVGREGVRFSPRAVELLAKGHWPGNVRELEEIVGRAIAFSPEPVISRALVLDVIAERSESIDAMRADRARQERARLIEALHASGGNVTHAAEALGKTRPAIYRLIAAHGIPLAWHRPKVVREGSGERGPEGSARAADRSRARRAGGGR